MGNTFGNTLHLTIFGESHGTAIGCVIDGLPAGIAIDWDKVSFEMRAGFFPSGNAKEGKG